MTTSLSIIRWEWFKLRRRWMPWILLAVIIAFTQVPYWGAYALSTRGAEIPQNLLLPGSIEFALTIGHTIALVAVVVWTASAFGSEFGWGTFRTVLAKGPGRWRFLLSIFALMVAMGVAWLIALCVAAGVSSAVVGLLEGGGSIANSGEWNTALVKLGKSAVALVPYVAMTMFFAVLTSSAGVATAITLVYTFLVENVLAAVLLFTVDWFAAVSDYVLGLAVNGWLAQGGDSDGLQMLLAVGGAGGSPGKVHGLLVMLAYTVVFLGATLWLFQRRDIGGAKGP